MLIEVFRIMTIVISVFTTLFLIFNWWQKERNLMTKNKYIKTLGLEENISKIVCETVKRYQKLMGDKNLYFYDNWKDDIIDAIVDYIKDREKIIEESK